MTEELKIKYTLATLSQMPNGTKALEILGVIAYFAPENIHTDILSCMVNDKNELEAAVQILKQCSLVHSGQDQSQINMDRKVQKTMLTILEEDKASLHVMEQIPPLFIMQGINLSNLDHAISVWGHISAYEKLIEKYSVLPNLILGEFKEQVRYVEGEIFGWKVLDLMNKTIGKYHPATLVIQLNLGALLGMMGKHKEALELLVMYDQLSIADSGQRAQRNMLITTARHLVQLCRFDEALKIYEENLFLNEKVSEANDSLMLSAWHDYAKILCDTGKYHRASEILKDILKRRSQIVDKEDGDTSSLKSSLAHIYIKESKFSKALKIFYTVLDERTKFFGANHVITSRTRRDIALVFQHQGRLTEALVMYTEVAEQFEKVLGEKHPETLAVHANIATVFQQIGAFEKALEIYRDTYEKQCDVLGKRHTEPLRVKYHIATILVTQNKLDVGFKVLQEVYEGYIEVFGPTHPETVHLEYTLKGLNHMYHKTELETIYSAVWEGDLNKVKCIVQSGIDINNTDSYKKTPLYYAAQFGHAGIVKLLLEKGAIYNAQSEGGQTPLQITENSEIKNLLISVAELIIDAKEGNLEQMSKYIAGEKEIVNAKDNDGSNALHWAAHNGHKDIVKLLLESGANATQVTNKGNTPLHIATSKGYTEIIKILLQYINRDDLYNFINAKTNIGGVTSIHVAAKNGFLEIVKSLLKHGAIYNVKNNQCKTPLELSNDRNITNLLTLGDELFQDAKNGNPKIISKLEHIEHDEFLAVTSARNNEGNTLLQVTITNKHDNIAGKFLEMVKKTDRTEPWPRSKWSIDQLEKLKKVAKLHIRSSSTYLPRLRSMSDSCDSGKNSSRWKTLKEGSAYLANVHRLVEAYKACTQGSINNQNIETVNALLVELEFDPKHMTIGYTDEAYGGLAECFVSKGQGTKYYKLLHSELKADVRLFLEMVELDIDLPVKRFLESLQQKLKSVITDKLFKAVESNNHTGVEDCIKEGVDINSKNTEGGTPLHYAVNIGDIGIINSLLKNGADVTQVTAKGNTPLHIAISKESKEIVELLLQHTSPEKLNDFINAQTTIGGTASLHVAARNGSVDIVKSLLKQGAIFNIKNKDGKRPVDIARDQNVINLLKLTHELFQDVRHGNLEIIMRLENMESDEFSVLTHARNNQGNTLLQVAMNNKNKSIESKLLEMFKKRDYIQLFSNQECRLKQLKNLKSSAELHINFSELYLPMLRNRSYPHDSDRNLFPWKTVNEGSYYLGNVYSLVEQYKKCMNGTIYDTNIQTVNDMLVDLQFVPEDNSIGYIDEAYGGGAACFVLKCKGTKYYELLHSEFNKDVRLFLEMVELNIEVPVKRFIESMQQEIQSILSEQLFRAIECNNDLEVAECLQYELQGDTESKERVSKGVLINIQKADGGTPLHYAINNGNIGIINILLQNGADVTRVTTKGNTPLHIAISKGHKEIVEILLQHASPDELNALINAQTTVGGTASLHVAAKNGSIDCVKSLLKHGAIYDIKNKEGKTPLDLSEDRDVINLLKRTEELFQNAENGDCEIVNKLQHAQLDEFTALTNARNNEGVELLQVAINNKYKNMTNEFLESFRNPHRIQSLSSPKCKLEQLEMLQKGAELYMKASQLYLLKLRSMSQSCDSEKNSSPHITLRDGFCYLENAYSLVRIYKWCTMTNSEIDDEDMQAVNDMLIALEFRQEHVMFYADEASHKQLESFPPEGRGTRYYNLLHSRLKKDVGLFIEMVERNIEVPVKNFLESIKQKLQLVLPEKLFEAIENNNPLEVEDHIKNGVDVNSKNTDGGTPLHYAVNIGDISIINSLLKNGADVTQVTAKGNTLLHIAISKESKEIVELLLQHTSPEKLNDFINAQTTIGGTASLHVAARNGSVDIVKSLLKHGAIFNIKDRKGKRPIDISRDQNIINLLKLTNELFQGVRHGNLEIITQLQHMEPDEFSVLTNARDNQGNTLLNVAINNKHKSIESELLEMFKKREYSQLFSNQKCRLKQLKNLKSSAELHINSSELYLSMLRNRSYPDDSDRNLSPWKTVNEGSYYLGNVYSLVEQYKKCMNGTIYDTNIQTVNDMLVDLQFVPEDNSIGYIDEAYDGGAACFVLKCKGTKYYELLHSEFNKDVRLFLEMVELNIEVPVKRFIESMQQEIQSILSEQLFRAIECNNDSEVAECLQYEPQEDTESEERVSKGVLINIQKADGGTPLHYAINNGNIGIINILLQNGADVTRVTTKGNTPLHIAITKGHKEIVEILLQHASPDELNALINAQTTVGGTASLHVAAKNGSIDCVKSLLKHGAIYDIKNEEGKTPLELSKDGDVINLLKRTEELFQNAENGDCEIVNKLQHAQLDEFTALTNARNNEGVELLQVAINNKYRNMTSEFLELFRNPHRIQSLSSPKCKLEQLEMFKKGAELYMNASQLYLLKLRSMSQSCDSEENSSPHITLRDGFCYLENAYSLVGIYKWCTMTNSEIDDEYMQAVNDMLIALEFRQEHVMFYADEASHKQLESFPPEGRGTRYYNLLHSRLKKDVRLFIEMVERNIEVPVTKFLELIKQKLQLVLPEKLFEAIENNNPLEVEDHIRNGVDVNSKNTNGRTPLHYAVHNGNVDIINILLKNGADATQVTTKGNTPLHIATSKDFKEIVKVLLQHVSHDKSNDFINAQTVGGTTSLHVAAKNGSWDIVISLLKHGAIYNKQNKEGKTPLDLSRDQNISNLLKLSGELFQDAKKGNPEIFSKLQHMELDKFIALGNACDAQGNTLLQVATANNHKNIANQYSAMLKKPDKIRSWSNPKLSLDQIEKLKRAAELYIQCSESYLAMLRNTSQSNRSEKNSFPWATLKAGSCYLQNVHKLVEVYNEYMHGSIDDKNIQTVNSMLVELEFNPKHITLGYTDEAFDGKVECFVSKGQGTKYYELLHSELKKDVRSFVEMVQSNVDIHVKMFLKSISQKYRSTLSEMLFEAIEDNNNVEVKNCLRDELVVKLKSTDGKTPLHYAVNNGNMSIINTLLKHGVDVSEVANNGDTSLHIASSKGNKRIVEVLLQHTSHDRLNEFINAQMIVEGTALHIASKNGFLEVVESLLKHGAIYNIRNQAGQTPLDLSKDENVTNLLNLVQTLFEDAKSGNFRAIRKLKTQPFKFTAITNTLNDQGQSLVQVAVSNKNQGLAAKLEMVIKTKTNSTGY